MLELVGQDRAAGGEPPGGLEVGIRADNHPIGHGRRRAVLVGVEHRDPVAELAGGDGQHPAELPTTEDPDHRRRQDRSRQQGYSAVDGAAGH